jgi:hypothetical protein
LGLHDLFDPDGAADRHFFGPLSGRPEAIAYVLFGVISTVFGLDPFFRFLGVSLVIT